MILNQTAEYALRAMAVLAAVSPSERLSSADLARRANLPTHYVSKVMRRLVLARLVTSQRGHGGGFALAREPSGIRIIDVLEAVEFQPAEGQCAFGVGECNPSSPCALHPAYASLHATFLRWARETMLVDMAPENAASSAPFPS